MHLWTDDKFYQNKELKSMDVLTIWHQTAAYTFHMFDCFAGYNKFKLRRVDQNSRRNNYGVHSTLGIIIATVAAGSNT